MNYQKAVAILTDFWQKRRLKDRKKKKLKEKSQKLTKKSRIVPILSLKRILKLCKTLLYQFARFTFQYSIKIIFTKTRLQAEKLGHLDQKAAKNLSRGAIVV